MPNDIAVPVVPIVAVAGKVSQLSGLERLTDAVPSLAERVEGLADVVPPSSTEKSRDVGENDKVGRGRTVRVTVNGASTYPIA